MTPPEEPLVILATDCGSTTTKAVLIERQSDGSYRQTHRGEAPTTVEEPVADVTAGVRNAAIEVGELAGRRIVDDEGRLIHPSRDDGPEGKQGIDLYVTTSSAGGGLQMMVAGVVKEMSAASAERAALGAGAIVMETLAVNDGLEPHERVARVRDRRPDMMLLAGGTDGGNLKIVAEMAELIGSAKPEPRFGSDFTLPVVYAGNAAASDVVADTLDDDVALTTVPNVRPVLEREDLAAARDAIHDVFLEHVMQSAPGYPKLIAMADAPVVPTPGAVGDILKRVAARDGVNALAVDIGGATTDVFSVFENPDDPDGEPVFNRTVSANLGMSYSISNVVAEAGLANVLRWLTDADVDEGELRNRIKNKMIRPTTIPETAEALAFEQAVAREALRLAYEQHRAFATTLRGVQRTRTVGDTFDQSGGGESVVDPTKLDLLIGSGGVLSHAPDPRQTAMMLIDAFRPKGVTRLAKDRIFMMPHLGVLAGVHERAAVEVFEADCLTYLGTHVAAVGVQWSKKTPVIRYEIEHGGTRTAGSVRHGQIEVVDLPDGESATLTATPCNGGDLGGGRNRAVSVTVSGGAAGLILDGRVAPE